LKDVLFNLASRIVSRARDKGFSDLEFYGKWVREIRVEVSRNSIKAVLDRSTIVFGVLGAVGKRIGSVGSEDVAVDVDALLDKLYSIAKSSREDADWRGFAKGYGRGVEASIYDKKVEELEPDTAVEITLDGVKVAVDAARRRGAEEAVVTEGGYTAITGGIFVANLNGEEQYVELTSSGIGFEIKSRKSGEESSYYAFYESRRLDTEGIIKECERGGEYSVLFLGAKPVESGEYAILLDPYMTALFISTALAPAFSALEVQENRSPLKGRIGEKVLSEAVDVYDDPGIDWGLGSRPFDDEGIATSRKPLVERGVLKTFLYNYYTAARENRASTGNGFRRAPSTPTRPFITNMVVQVRGITASEDEMVREMKRGIVVHGMIGYWMSNYVNGSTQATISHGLLVEGGEVKRAVKGVVLGGNIYEWLGKNLVYAGRDVKYVMNVYAPAIMFEKGRIAG